MIANYAPMDCSNASVPKSSNSIREIKREHLEVPAGGEIIRIGDAAPEVFTLYAGWAFRYKMLSDGRRQILSFMLPGDLLGLQAAMFDAALFGIEALTDVQLCVLPRKRLWTLFGKVPDLAFDVAWLGSRSESFVDENLTSVGRRTAAERVAALIVTLYKRAKVLGMVEDETFAFPPPSSISPTRSACPSSTPTKRWRGSSAWACSSRITAP